MIKIQMKHLSCLCAILGLIALIAAVPAQAHPPICGYMLGWDSGLQTWNIGAPWVKVMYSSDIAAGKNCGSKVFYRPYDTSVGTDDGDMPGGLTGTAYANAVWAKISGLSQKPDAIGYRNEFAWYGNSSNRYTAAQFRPFRDRLRALGYTGWVIYGSWGVGWPDTVVWDEPEVADAASCADGIETHEYFDLTVACISPYLTFRHRDLAINARPSLLGSKPWFIGEYGSDMVCGASGACGDSQCRGGWRENGKLSEAAYITQTTAYRAGCHDNVAAVFVFKMGTGGWANYDVANTSISTYMKTTWGTPPTTGTITGWVKTTGGTGISGATVSTNTGGYTTTTNSSGVYTLSNVNAGTYNVTASKSGYTPVTNTGVVVTANNTTTSNFTLQTSGMNNNTPTGTNYAGSSTTIQTDTYYGAGFEGAKAVDGLTTTKWCSTGVAPPHWLALDLGQSRTVNGFIVKLPGGCGEYATYNAKNFKFQSATSLSGPWTDECVVDNTAQANTVARSYITPKSLRYVRLYITNSGIDNYSRIPEFEVWCAGGGGPIASEAFTTLPTWTSTFNAAWGSTATFVAASGGQSGNQMQAYRASQGSSVKAKVYTVPASTSITISVYIKCPSYAGGTYWIETGYRMGSNTAQDFDANPGNWTLIKKFSNTGTNGNGNVWTQYTSTVNTGSNTQVTIGYKHGASGCVGPTVGWDTFAIN